MERSGLWHAFENRVLIDIDKEQELADVERPLPPIATPIDDKLRILAAVKKIWVKRVTTVFPEQGYDAFDPSVLAEICWWTSSWRRSVISIAICPHC